MGSPLESLVDEWPACDPVTATLLRRRRDTLGLASDEVVVVLGGASQGVVGNPGPGEVRQPVLRWAMAELLVLDVGVQVDEVVPVLVVHLVLDLIGHVIALDQVPGA